MSIRALTSSTVSTEDSGWLIKKIEDIRITKNYRSHGQALAHLKDHPTSSFLTLYTRSPKF